MSPEVFHANFKFVSRPDISFATYVGFDVNKLGNLQLGTLLNFSQAIPCLLSSIHAANFTQLKIKVKSIKEPKVTGFVSKGFDSLLGSTVSGAFAMMGTFGGKPTLSGIY